MERDNGKGSFSKEIDSVNSIADEEHLGVHYGQLEIEEEETFRTRANLRRIRGTIGFLIHSLWMGWLFIDIRTFGSLKEGIVTSKFMIAFKTGEASFSAQQVASFVPMALLLVVVAKNYWFYFVNTKFTWPRNTAEARQPYTDDMLSGLTSLFRQYVHSRKIGLYGHAWSAWGFMFVVFCWKDELAYATLSTILMSFLNLYVSFRISSSFSIGPILVDHIALVNERASTSQMSIRTAKFTLDELLKRYRKRRYWWFY